VKRPVPQGLMLAGCAVAVISTFLHWTAVDFWKAEQSLHLKVLVGALVPATIVLCGLALRRRGSVSQSLTGAVGLLTGGAIVGIGTEVSSFHPKIGATVGLAAGIIISIGGLLAVLQSSGSVVAPAQRDRPAPTPTPAPVPAPVPVPAPEPVATRERSRPTEPVESGVPAGWYDDPSGQHSERRWDGSAWTDETR
jgi:Protein of unknown function (DUF2510)